MLLEEIRDLELPIGEKTLTLDDLHSAREVFITSTTRELLPVESIDSHRLQGGRAICDRLRQAFSARVRNYIEPRRSPVYN